MGVERGGTRRCASAGWDPHLRCPRQLDIRIRTTPLPLVLADAAAETIELDLVDHPIPLGLFRRKPRVKIKSLRVPLKPFSIDTRACDHRAVLQRSDPDPGPDSPLAVVFQTPWAWPRIGDSLFEQTNNSGIAQIDAPGVSARGHLPSSGGDVQRGTGPGIYQYDRCPGGFQANSRVISASDEMLQGLVNLKR